MESSKLTQQEARDKATFLQTLCDDSLLLHRKEAALRALEEELKSLHTSLKAKKSLLQDIESDLSHYQTILQDARRTSRTQGDASANLRLKERRERANSFKSRQKAFEKRVQDFEQEKLQLEQKLSRWEGTADVDLGRQQRAFEEKFQGFERKKQEQEQALNTREKACAVELKSLEANGQAFKKEVEQIKKGQHEQELELARRQEECQGNLKSLESLKRAFENKVQDFESRKTKFQEQAKTLKELRSKYDARKEELQNHEKSLCEKESKIEQDYNQKVEELNNREADLDRREKELIDAKQKNFGENWEDLNNRKQNLAKMDQERHAIYTAQDSTFQLREIELARRENDVAQREKHMEKSCVEDETADSRPQTQHVPPPQSQAPRNTPLTELRKSRAFAATVEDDDDEDMAPPSQSTLPLDGENIGPTIIPNPTPPQEPGPEPFAECPEVEKPQPQKTEEPKRYIFNTPRPIHSPPKPIPPPRNPPKPQAEHLPFKPVWLQGIKDSRWANTLDNPEPKVEIPKAKKGPDPPEGCFRPNPRGQYEAKPDQRNENPYDAPDTSFGYTSKADSMALDELDAWHNNRRDSESSTHGDRGRRRERGRVRGEGKGSGGERGGERGREWSGRSDHGAERGGGRGDRGGGGGGERGGKGGRGGGGEERGRGSGGGGERGRGR